jgi:osmotically inducible lipoprotein OsmB
MSRFRIAFAAFLLSFAFPSFALADTVQGTVLKTGWTALDLTVYDAQGRPYPNPLHLKVDSQTRVSGVSSPAALRPKDSVRVDVRQEKNGVWRADNITKTASTAQAVAKTAGGPPPSNALMDALKSPTGQNTVKGALGGAVVGGVSSAASGGKAGKGALIGAGVGAAAGLLQGLFNQPQAQPAVNVRPDDSQG